MKREMTGIIGKKWGSQWGRRHIITTTKIKKGKWSLTRSKFTLQKRPSTEHSILKPNLIKISRWVIMIYWIGADI